MELSKRGSKYSPFLDERDGLGRLKSLESSLPHISSSQNSSDKRVRIDAFTPKRKSKSPRVSSLEKKEVTFAAKLWRTKQKICNSPLALSQDFLNLLKKVEQKAMEDKSTKETAEQNKIRNRFERKGYFIRDITTRPSTPGKYEPKFILTEHRSPKFIFKKETPTIERSSATPQRMRSLHASPISKKKQNSQLDGNQLVDITKVYKKVHEKNVLVPDFEHMQSRRLLVDEAAEEAVRAKENKNYEDDEEQSFKNRRLFKPTWIKESKHYVLTKTRSSLTI
jgi:hypothetical protein